MTDVVGAYLKGDFADDLSKMIDFYEEYTGIDAFFNNAATPKYFYEWTIQGMIYALITQQVGAESKKTLLLLEQPYTASNALVRSDIMWIDLADENSMHDDLIFALELKTDFNATSVQNDLAKLAAQIKVGTIASGYMIFLCTNPDDAQNWVSSAENANADVKNYIKNHQLFAIPVKAQQE